MSAWFKVVYAADCQVDDDGETLICPTCDMDYAECPCPGPHQDDEFDYREVSGTLFARRKQKRKL